MLDRPQQPVKPGSIFFRGGSKNLACPSRQISAMQIVIVILLSFDLSYLDRLRKLNAETLLERRIKSDLILVYKILHGMVDCLDSMLELDNVGRTRGHSWKLKHKTFRVNARKNFFSVRITNIWNQLPDDIVSTPTLFSFKKKLRRLSFHESNLEYFG